MAFPGFVIGSTMRTVSRRLGTRSGFRAHTSGALLQIVFGLAVLDADRHTFDRPWLEIE
jgi:hypothetical protein